MGIGVLCVTLLSAKVLTETLEPGVLILCGAAGSAEVWEEVVCGDRPEGH